MVLIHGVINQARARDLSLGHLGMPFLWFLGDFRNVGFNEIVGFTGVSICTLAVLVSWYQIRRDAKNMPF